MKTDPNYRRVVREQTEGKPDNEMFMTTIEGVRAMLDDLDRLELLESSLGRIEPMGKA